MQSEGTHTKCCIILPGDTFTIVTDEASKQGKSLVIVESSTANSTILGTDNSQANAWTEQNKLNKVLRLLYKIMTLLHLERLHRTESKRLWLWTILAQPSSTDREELRNPVYLSARIVVVFNLGVCWGDRLDNVRCLKAYQKSLQKITHRDG